MVKKVKFVSAAAEKEFLGLPEEIQTRFKLDLRAIQKGSRPFSKVESIYDSVGDGALELKKNGRPAYRSIYVAKMPDAIWVLYSFVKTVNGVDRKAMKTAKGRYQMMSGLKEGDGVILNLEEGDAT